MRGDAEPKVHETSANFPPLAILVSVLLLLFFAGQLWYHAVSTSSTVDEPNHILAGHRHWCGDFGANPEHPPLLKLLATAPLNFRSNLSEPPWECGSKFTSKFDTFTYGNTFLVENGVDSVVVTTRLAASLMTLALAVLLFFAAREMFGVWEAVVALAILSFEPGIIAHGSIVTTDMALTVTSLGAVYAIYRFGKNPGWQRLLVCGVTVGLMLAAKHSAVIFLAALWVLIVGDAALFRRDSVKPLRGTARASAAYAGILLIAVGALELLRISLPGNRK